MFVNCHMSWRCILNPTIDKFYIPPHYTYLQSDTKVSNLMVDVSKKTLPWINVHNFYIFEGRKLKFCLVLPTIILHTEFFSEFNIVFTPCCVFTMAASWRKRLGARLPPMGSRVRVSVTPRGFRGGRKGVWVGFSRFLLPQITFHHFSILISFI